jgi:hypothetical protein
LVNKETLNLSGKASLTTFIRQLLQLPNQGDFMICYRLDVGGKGRRHVGLFANILNHKVGETQSKDTAKQSGL